MLTINKCYDKNGTVMPENYKISNLPELQELLTEINNSKIKVVKEDS